MPREPRLSARYGDRVTESPDPILTHPAVTRVREALTAAGVPGQVIVLDGAARTAAQAAAYLGVTVAQIANSLVFAARATPDAEPEPLLVLTSGGHRVDTAKVAADLGLHELGRADADFVRGQTGFAIGGVAPVGHATVTGAPIRTLVDTALAAYQQIWAAGGHPHAVFPTTFDELVRISGGTPAEVA